MFFSWPKLPLYFLRYGRLDCHFSLVFFVQAEKIKVYARVSDQEILVVFGVLIHGYFSQPEMVENLAYLVRILCLCLFCAFNPLVASGR